MSDDRSKQPQHQQQPVRDRTKAIRSTRGRTISTRSMTIRTSGRNPAARIRKRTTSRESLANPQSSLRHFQQPRPSLGREVRQTGPK